MVATHGGEVNHLVLESRDMSRPAIRHLSRVDPVMRALIRRTGPCTITIRKRWSPFQSLVRAAPVMHGIVKDLTPAEIQALAAYVQSK